MTDLGLSNEILSGISNILSRYPSVVRASVYGSRAKGMHKPYSDVDISLYGGLDLFTAMEIQNELDEIPSPYTFDVAAYGAIKNQDLKDHIDRVGVDIFIRE